MDKQQKLKIALPVLVVIMVFVWGPIIFGPRAKGVSDVADKRATGGVSGNSYSGAANTAKPRPSGARTQFIEWGENPFMLKRTPKALYIEGILWDEAFPQAIINGEILRVGDTIENKTILQIKPRSVVISGDEGSTELNLSQ